MRNGTICRTSRVEWVVAIFTCVNNAIAALGDLTIGAASIDFIVGVKGTVVTGLGAADDTVSTGCLTAVVVAAISIDVVLVIALFKSIDHTISAIGQGWVGAVFGARTWTIGIERVTIF